MLMSRDRHQPCIIIDVKSKCESQIPWPNSLYTLLAVNMGQKHNWLVEAQISWLSHSSCFKGLASPLSPSTDTTMETQGIILGRCLERFKSKVDNLATALTGLNLLNERNLLYENIIERNMWWVSKWVVFYSKRITVGCREQFRIHRWAGFILGFKYMIWTCLNNEEWESILGRSQTWRQECLNHAEGPHDQISRWLTLELSLSTNYSMCGQRFSLIGEWFAVWKKRLRFSVDLFALCKRDTELWVSLLPRVEGLVVVVASAATSLSFTCVNLFNHPRTLEVSNNIIQILQMRKLRLREVKKKIKEKLIYDHRARKHLLITQGLYWEITRDWKRGSYLIPKVRLRSLDFILSLWVVVEDVTVLNVMWELGWKPIPLILWTHT